MLLDGYKKEKIMAMKAKDTATVSALSEVINKLMLLSIDKRAKGQELVEADSVSVLQKVEKELIEEKTAFEKVGKQEIVAELEAKIAVIKKYLPQLMSEEEVTAIIIAMEDRSIPTVMKHFKANYQGKVDMRIVQQVVAKLK
ncbi:MAG: GatB/YqeY domain-containing protein [Bacillota bacterium]